MTFAELHALDDAYWFTAEGVGPGHPADAYLYRGIRTGARPAPAGYVPDDFAVPRFTDLAVRFADLPLNIEIEGSGAAAAATAAALASALHDLHREDSVVVTSFDDATVSRFHRLAPTVEVTPGRIASALWVLVRLPLPPGMRILQLPPAVAGATFLTPASIAAAHAAGYAVWVWPNDRALENLAGYRRLLHDGVDGLNINVPTDGVAAVREMGPTSA